MVAADRVDRIRAAAELMRRRATAATPGPWWAAVGQGPKRRKQQVALVGRADMRGQGAPGCIAVLAGLHNPRADDAEHIAGAHPGVMLAVADWLVYEATKAALGWTGQSDRALAVADAYLGAES